MPRKNYRNKKLYKKRRKKMIKKTIILIDHLRREFKRKQGS